MSLSTGPSPPKARSNSVKLVTRVGEGTMNRSPEGSVTEYGTGPYRASPLIPNVDVATPSIDLERKLVSSR